MFAALNLCNRSLHKYSDKMIVRPPSVPKRPGGRSIGHIAGIWGIILNKKHIGGEYAYLFI